MNQAELNRLIDELIDGALSSDDRQRLEALLHADAEARTVYRRRIDLHARLQWEMQGLSAAGSRQTAVSPAMPRPSVSWLLLARYSLAAAVLLAVGAMLFWPRDRVIARVEQVEGEVYVETARGKLAARPGTAVHVGERVATHGPASQATLVLANQTRLELGSETAVQPESGQRIRLLAGEVSGTAIERLELVTPLGEARVWGGRFSSISSALATRVEMEEGNGEVSRSSDGQTIEVQSGNMAVVYETAELASRPLAPRISQAQREIKEQAGPVRAFAWSPDGRRFASAGPNGAVTIHDGQAGTRLALAGHARQVSALVFSPDGQRLASAGNDGWIKLWSVLDGSEQASLLGSPHPLCLAFSPDGQTLAAGGYHRIAGKRDYDIRLFDLASGRVETLPAVVQELISALAFTADGQTLIAVSEKGSVRLWDAAKRQLRTTLVEQGPRVECLALSRDGRLLGVGGASPLVRLWNLETGEELPALLTAGSSVVSLSFSPDGRTLASCDARRSRGAHVWDVQTGGEVVNFRAVTRTFTAVAFSPDGKTLATAGTDETIRFWIMSSRKREN